MGLLEYISQSNDCADFVNEEDRYRFVDDLTVLEIVNVLTVGITSYNLKSHIPSDVPHHNGFIDPVKLSSQAILDKLNDWTINQKMLINEKKTKTMIFNFTRNHQFTTRLSINDQNIEVIDEAKLLGTTFTTDLKWDVNTANLVRKANASMQLLRKIAEFAPPISDLKQIYILFVRSILEQSSVVWHSSLTQENKSDLERVQKSAVKIILGDSYRGYKNALNVLNLQSLDERREELCLKFAKKCTRHPKLKGMFPKNIKEHTMSLRTSEKYKVEKTSTERYKNSPVVYMQRLLNSNES